MIYRQIGKTTEQTCKSICSGYSKGCDIITPGASTVAKFKTGFLEIFQISECLKQSVVNAFYVRSPFPTQCPPNATDSTSHHNQPGASYLAISMKEHVSRGIMDKETGSPSANLNIFSKIQEQISKKVNLDCVLCQNYGRIFS